MNTKKYFTFLAFFIFASTAFSQTICTQTFTVSGLDVDPTTLTINMSDLNCFGAGTPVAISLVNPQISDDDCGPNAPDNYYSFNLDVDGNSILSDACNDAFNNIDITGFTTLSIFSQDNDNYPAGDAVTITIDVQVVYANPGDNTCFEPYNVTFSNVSGNSADVTWQDYISTVTNWNYVVQPLGGAAPTTGGIPTNTNTVSLSGLNPALTYEFYVQADCGGGSLSDWAGPFVILNTLVPSFVGNASSLGGDCYLITDDLLAQQGAVWYNNPIDLTNDFEIIFDANFGANDGNGADGMTFVLKDNANSVIGQPGGGIGYADIDNSVIVEFDTFQNDGELSSTGYPSINDPGEDHISIQANGDPRHDSSNPNSLAPAVQASATSANIEDNIFHEVKIIWTATTQTLDVYFDCSLRVSYTGDIATNIIGSNICYFGFTGTTGGFSNRHELCFKRISFVDSLTLVDKAICSGDSVNDIDATYTDATAYNWTPTAGVSDPTLANPVFTPTTTTTYTVAITDNCGLDINDSFTINVTEAAVSTLSSNTPICEGEDAVFTIVGTPNAVVSYSTDGGTTTNMETLDASGNATVTVTNPTAAVTMQLSDVASGACNTALTNSETVVVISALSITSLTAVIPEITAGDNAEFNLVGTPNATVTYTLDGGTTTQTVTLDASGTATVTVQTAVEEVNISLLSISLNSCTDVLSNTETVLVTINEIPSGFSPNGDGINDTFDIKFLAKNIKVYNRYGYKVYEKTLYRNEWNGNSEAGDKLPVGTYYYIIENNNGSPLTGWVYINREK